MLCEKGAGRGWIYFRVWGEGREDPTKEVPELGGWEGMTDKGNCPGKCPEWWERCWHAGG